VGRALAGARALGGQARADAKDTPVNPSLDRLAGQLQETPPGKLFGVLKGLLDKGTDVRELVAAGAIANTRAFAGQDYDGYHTFMALPPAYAMARELPEAQRALPVFKVLYRNATLIADRKCHEKDEMHAPAD